MSANSPEPFQSGTAFLTASSADAARREMTSGFIDSSMVRCFNAEAQRVLGLPSAELETVGDARPAVFDFLLPEIDYYPKPEIREF